MKNFLSISLSVFAALLAAHASATPPAFDLSASATNLVVTEKLSFTLSLTLPPLPEPFQDNSPVLSRNPPHVTADFLDREWESPLLSPESPDAIFTPPPSKSHSASFTLNKYVNNSLFSMSDPFDVFGDDPFARRNPFAPRRARFPFSVSRVSINGTNCWRFTATTPPYRAAKPGNLSLPPATLEIPLITSVKTSRNRFGETVAVPEIKETVLASPPLSITVLAPPETNRPASFCGAIGPDISATASLDASVCTAGDPLTLTLTISGGTDLSMVTPPDFSQHLSAAGFRLDSASLKTSTLPDSRRFTWRVRPLKTGTIEFPPIPVSFFDVDTRAYATVSTPSIPIQVKAGAQAALGSLDPADSLSDQFPLPDGIDLSPSAATPSPLLPSLRTTLALFILPPLAFILVRLAPPLRRRLASRLASRRLQNAWPKCRRILASSAPAPKKLDAIRTFLSIRFNVNGRAATPADAERLMSPHYPPADVALVSSTLAEADRSSFSSKPIVASILVILALLTPSPAHSSTPSPDRARFACMRANTLATRATTPEQFAAAAAAYADCLAAGASTPALWQNYAACSLMAGNPAAALSAYAAAERRTGATPSTTRGILAAHSRRTNDPRAELPLARSFFAPHYKYSLDLRLLASAILWTLAWLAALLPPSPLRRTLLALLALAFTAAALSSAISLTQELLHPN